jgi:hypothetical protein
VRADAERVPQREFQAIRAHRAAGADGDGERRLVPGLGHIPGNGNQSSGSRRAARRVHVLPDILHYDRTKPATYPNGRILTDDMYSLRFAWLSNGKIPPSGIKPHDDLLAHFPYLGPPNPTP